MNTLRRRTRRVRRSPEQREELLRRFHAGDSPQADFCREHDVHPATLSQWLRKCPAPAFHEVVLPPRPQTALDSEELGAGRLWSDSELRAAVSGAEPP